MKGKGLVVCTGLPKADTKSALVTQLLAQTWNTHVTNTRQRDSLTKSVDTNGRQKRSRQERKWHHLENVVKTTSEPTTICPGSVTCSGHQTSPSHRAPGPLPTLGASSCTPDRQRTAAQLGAGPPPGRSRRTWKKKWGLGGRGAHKASLAEPLLCQAPSCSCRALWCLPTRSSPALNLFTDGFTSPSSANHSKGTRPAASC